MLRCDAISERSTCEFDPTCSWAEDKKQCQRKPGSLAAAMLEAKPPPKATSQTPCPGVETQVGNETRCLKPGDSFKDCPDCPEMVVIPAGSFMMGSQKTEQDHFGVEYPQHKVTIAKPLAIGKFEVTFAEWDACLVGRGCQARPSEQDRGRRPAISVSWNDAQEYVAWLSRTTGKTYRLLSEAEWEYAARAGTTTPYSWGQTITIAQANFSNQKGTVDVGSYLPNAFGLYDMHFNVSEWVEDCWHPNYQGAPSDGSPWTTACWEDFPDYRAVRGGSWEGLPLGIDVASRGGLSRSFRSLGIGFRLARTLNP